MSDTWNAPNADPSSDPARDPRPPTPPTAPWQQPPPFPSRLARLFDGQNQGVVSKSQQQPQPPTPQPAAPQPQLAREWPPKGSASGPFPTWPPPWRAARVQPYVPAFPNRPPNQWGQPGQWEQAPQPWEVLGIYQGLARSISAFGSGTTQPTAAAMGQHSAAWQVGYQKGLQNQADLHYKLARNHALDLENALQDDMTDYGDAFVAAGANPDADTDDPSKLPNYNQLMTRLHDLAVQKNDQQMLMALQKGAGQAEQLLRYRDAKWKDLHQANKAAITNEIQTEGTSPYIIQGQNPSGTPSSAGPSAPSGWHIGPNGGVIFDSPNAPAEPSTPSAPSAAPDASAPPTDGTAAPPPSTDGSGAGGGADSGDTTAPSASPDSTPPADSGAPAYTPHLDLGADAGTPAPGADQTAASGLPPQGVQVAEAGASDAPPAWMGQGGGAAAQPAQPDFSPAPSKVLGDAFNKYRADPVSLDRIARSYLEGQAKQGDYKNTFPWFWPTVVARAGEIQGDLDRIEKSNLKGDAVIKAINAVDPTIAATVKGYADGSIPPPRSAAQLRPGLARDLALATKYDPTFTGSTYQTRAGTLRGFTVGTQGQNLVSIATAYAHLKSYKADLERLKTLDRASIIRMKTVGGQEPYGIPLGRMAGSTPEENALMGSLDNEMETSSNEYERGTTGGKPTVSGRDEQMGQMNWKSRDPDVVIANVDNKIALLKARMDKLKLDFTAGTGRQPESMFKLFDQFSASGAAKAGSDALGATTVPDASTGKALGELNSAPIASPRNADDSRALEWARSHPDDPRSKQILDHLGQ